MWVKGKFCRLLLIKKLNIIFLTFFFYLFFVNSLQANFQEELINKYKTINTLHFDFTQKIGEEVEFGNCYIKYPLLMKCFYQDEPIEFLFFLHDLLGLQFLLFQLFP